MRIFSDVCHQHFMLEWAISSFYWVLCFLLGVFTNLCCETLDVRKRQWIISKNKINRSINHSTDQINQFDKIIDQSINHQWGYIDDWGWELGMRRKNWAWGSEPLLLGWVGRNGSITTVCMWLCAYVCVCFCVRDCICVHERTHARVCVCMYVCVWVCKHRQPRSYSDTPHSDQRTTLQTRTVHDLWIRANGCKLVLLHIGVC